MRHRKPANIEYDLERFHAPIVDEPAIYQGIWQQSFMPDAREVRLDLGCGKGTFIAAAAQVEPDVLFIGIDISPICIARAAEKVVNAGVENVRLVIADAADVASFFGEEELARIYLNFNAPFPKTKLASKRLVHLEHLLRYRPLVGEAGIIDMRTDNVLYWKFALTQFDIAGYTVLAQEDDLHAAAAEGRITPDKTLFLTSEYDLRTVARGARIHWLLAQPGPAPAHCEQTAALGLVDYLPEDIENFDEIPFGMEDTVANMRQRRANARARAERAERRARAEQAEHSQA